MPFVAKSFFLLVVVGLVALVAIQINPISSTVQLKANDGISDEANDGIFDEANDGIFNDAIDGISNEANDGIFDILSFDEITPVSNIVLATIYDVCPATDSELIIDAEARPGRKFDAYAYADTAKPPR